jgi:hypothetical protein
MRSAADVWICGRCRSINNLSSPRCYRCHTPREIAASKLEDLSIHHVEEPLAATGTFRSGEMRAVFATVFAVLFILVTFVALFFVYLASDAAAAGNAARAAELRGGPVLVLIGLAVAAGIATLIAYATWIRLAIENLPALGLGYSGVSSTWAFFEPLIPGVNLAGIPARLAEVAQKLEISSRTFPLIGLAGILVIGPSLVAVWVIRFTRFLGTGAEFLRLTSLSGLVLFAFQSVAIVLLLVVVWQIEGQFRERGAKAAVAAPVAA